MIGRNSNIPTIHPYMNHLKQNGFAITDNFVMVDFEIWAEFMRNEENQKIVNSFKNKKSTTEK